MPEENGKWKMGNFVSLALKNVVIQFQPENIVSFYFLFEFLLSGGTPIKRGKTKISNFCLFCSVFVNFSPKLTILNPIGQQFLFQKINHQKLKKIRNNRY